MPQSPARPPQLHAARACLVGVLALVVAVGVGRFAYTPLLPLMVGDGLLDVADGGELAGIHFLGYLMGALAAQRLSARPRLTFRLSLVAVALATLGMGFTSDAVLWAVLRWIAGVASAFVLVLVYAHTVSWLGRPGLKGWVFAGIGIGIEVAGLSVLGLMVLDVASDHAWQVFGAAALGGAAVLSLLVSDEIPATHTRPGPRTALSTPVDKRLALAYGAMALGYIVPATFLPLMARDIVPDPLVFGWCWPVFGMAAAVSTLYAARLDARVSNRRLWIGTQAVMAVSLVVPAFMPSLGSMIVAGIGVGGTFMVITMLGVKEVQRTVPPADAPRHVAVLTTAFALGQMIGPVAAGWLFQWTGGFGAALMATGIVVALAALPLLGIEDRRQEAPRS